MRFWFAPAPARPRRNLLVSPAGAGHFGPTDNVLPLGGGEPIAGSVCGAPPRSGPFPGPGDDPFRRFGFSLHLQGFVVDAAGAEVRHRLLRDPLHPGVAVFHVPLVLPDMLGRESGFLAFVASPESAAFTRMMQLATIRL